MFESILFLLYAVLAVIIVAVAVRLRHVYGLFRMKTMLTPTKVIEDLPSVSVLIPARNESHAMTDCLQRIIASNYPKLEIIVLNDSSQDKTSSLIKAFAHDGVRFVDGQPLPKGWLGKNHALNELLGQASGTYALFIDVDTRLSPDSIEQMVAYATQEKAAMVSVLPRREDGLRLSTLFSPLRYFWTLLFHRTESPAVASSAWMVHRATFLDVFGDFSSMKETIQPEASVAAGFMQQKLYRFLIGTAQLGVSYEKKWHSQVDTSIRLLYPILGGRVINTLVALFDLLIVVSPLFVFATGALVGWSIHHAIAGMLWAGFAILYGTYLHKVWRRGWIIGSLLWDVMVLQEIVLIAISTWRYRHGTVTWKGRPVHLPSHSNK